MGMPGTQVRRCLVADAGQPSPQAESAAEDSAHGYRQSSCFGVGSWERETTKHVMWLEFVLRCWEFGARNYETCDVVSAVIVVCCVES